MNDLNQNNVEQVSNAQKALEYVQYLQKMFHGNVNFCCIYCTLLANFLISLEQGVIKKDKHVVDSLKDLVKKYFVQTQQATNGALGVVDQKLIDSSAYLVLQLAVEGFMLEGVQIRFLNIFNDIPKNLNITVKASILGVSEYGRHFISDYAEVLQPLDSDPQVDYQKKQQKMVDLIGDVIKVLVQVHDNRHLKTKAMGLANQRSIFG